MCGQCSAKPMVTFPAAKHCHFPVADTYFPSYWR